MCWPTHARASSWSRFSSKVAEAFAPEHEFSQGHAAVAMTIAYPRREARRPHRVPVARRGRHRLAATPRRFRRMPPHADQISHRARALLLSEREERNYLEVPVDEDGAVQLLRREEGPPGFAVLRRVRIGAVLYCSRACQAAHWREEHGGVCQAQLLEDVYSVTKPSSKNAFSAKYFVWVKICTNSNVQTTTHGK